MGNYQAYFLALDPGPRDPRVVAQELSAELRGAFEAATDIEAAVDDIFPEETAAVWTDEEGVYYGTGRNFDIYYPYDWIEPVENLSVAARWAVSSWQGEVEHSGGAKLYAWVNGQYRLIDERDGLYGANGDDIAWDFERTYNVPTRAGYSPDPSIRNDFVDDSRSAAANPNPQFSGVNDLETTDMSVLTQSLTDGDDAEAVQAANQIYSSVVSHGESCIDLLPELYTAFQNSATRGVVTAILREVPWSQTDLDRVFDTDDPRGRRGVMLYCLVNGVDKAPESVIRGGLTDTDETVRRLAVRAIERATIPRGQWPETDYFEALVDRVDDSNQAVREAATLASLQYVLGGPNEDTPASPDRLDAVATIWAEAMLTVETPLHDRVVEYKQRVYGSDEFWYSMPGEFVDRLPGVIATVAAQSDSDPPEVIREFFEYVSGWGIEYIEPSLNQLVKTAVDKNFELANQTLTEWVTSNNTTERRDRLEQAKEDVGVPETSN